MPEYQGCSRPYLEGYPPPPVPLKTLLGAGFAKSVCKILISKNLEVKILKTDDLGPRRWGWLRSVRLGHHRASRAVEARLDVTNPAGLLWKPNASAISQDARCPESSKGTSRQLTGRAATSLQGAKQYCRSSLFFSEYLAVRF